MSLSDNVSRGVAFLDANIPNWRSRVNVKKLKMNETGLCVGSQANESMYCDFVDKFNLTKKESIYLGFIAPHHGHIDEDKEYEELNSLWAAAVEPFNEMKMAQERFINSAKNLTYDAKDMVYWYELGKSGQVPDEISVYLVSVRQESRAEDYKKYLELKKFFEVK
jgi:hypothetical protein